MIRIALIALLLQMFQAANAQKIDYADRSRKLKTAGFIALGAGAALMVTGVVVAGSGDSVGETIADIGAGGILIGTGGIIALGSIPLFIAAKQSKSKAGISLVPGMQRNLVPVSGMAGFKSRPSPVLTLAVPLGKK